MIGRKEMICPPASRPVGARGLLHAAEVRRCASNSRRALASLSYVAQLTRHQVRIASTLCICMNNTESTPRYPITRTVEEVDTYHGVDVADPYRWLEDDRSEETAAWVAEQSRLSTEYLRALPHREAYAERLVEMFNSPRYTAPRRFGDRYFYVRNDGLQNHGVLYVEDVAARVPRVLLDPNTLSEDGTIAVTDMVASPDGALAAYALADSGSDWQTIRVRDVETGADLPDVVRWAKFTSIAWTHDRAGFFYSAYEAPTDDRPQSGALVCHRLQYHRIGTDQSEDLVIFERPDEPAWLHHAVVTDDGRYVLIHSYHNGYERIFMADLGDANTPRLSAPIVDLIGAFDARYSYAGNDGAVIYLVTDNDAPRSRVMAVDTANGNAVRTVIAEGPDTLESAMMVGDRFMLLYLHNAYHRVAFHDLDGAFVQELPLPTLGTVWPAERPREQREVFYMFTSFLYPPTVFRYDPTTGEQTEVYPSGLEVDHEAYETRQLWCTSADGTRVPMFVTHRRDIKLDGSNRALLYGYGGFGTSQTPMFGRWGLMWLEQGGVHAVVNVRGGGEFGDDWHRGGTRENKQNSFDDFIAAAEHLIATGYTSTEHLAAMGASNGGLLVTAVACRRPDLFAAVLPHVAVTDMLRYQLFTIGMAWQGDYGLSSEPEMFPTLYAYSPYHNVRAGTAYPAMLIATADHDDRVVPAHSFKFAARMQAAQTASAPILLRVSFGSGHGTGQPLSMIIDELADGLAFAVYHTTGSNHADT